MRMRITTFLLMALFIVSAVNADESVTIRVSPERIYPSSVHRVVLAESSKQGESPVWEASAGKLLLNGDTEVYWQAPAAVDKVTFFAITSKGRIQREFSMRQALTDNMVLVPAGKFVMGDSWTDTNDPYFVPTFQNMTDKPAHRVHLDAYWIDRNRVTNRQYAAYLEEARSQGLVRVTEEAAVGWHEGVEIPFYYFQVPRARFVDRLPEILGVITWDGDRFQVREGHEDHPVVDVTWAGSNAYARFYGKRLPTEAEWEKAARGTDARRYPWGNAAPTPYHAHVKVAQGNEFTPVGAFSPTGDSPYGVADLFGGFEWVHDWFDEFYYHNNYASRPIANPTGPEWGRDRPVRGVSVYQTTAGDEYLNPLSFRYQWIFEFGHGHLFAHSDTGFRAALSAPHADHDASKEAKGRPGEELPEMEPVKIPRPRLPEKYEY